jgi:hypothetical protein
MRGKRNNIIPQMFDVRPVDKDGNLDVQKIGLARKISKENVIRHGAIAKNIARSTTDIKSAWVHQIRNQRENKNSKKNIVPEADNNILDNFSKQFKNFHDVERIDCAEKELRRFKKTLAEEKNDREQLIRQEIPVSLESESNVKKLTLEFTGREEKDFLGETEYASHYSLENSDYFEKFKSPKRKEKKEKYKKPLTVQQWFSFKDLFFYERYFKPLSKTRLSFSFAGTLLLIFLIIYGVTTINKGLTIRKTAYENSGKVLASFMSAKDGITNKDFKSAALNFDQAYNGLDQIGKDIDSLGGIVVESSKYIPYLSKLSSGSHLAKAGKDFSRVGTLISENIQTLEKIKNSDGADKANVSYLKIFQDTKGNLDEVAKLLADAQENLDSVNVDDIPENNRSRFIELKQKLPEANRFLTQFTANEEIFTDILGGNGPRKYLFLFENNEEMRATGGFIGTYAVLDIFNGHIRNFFVDGIFNPDGQLQDRIVPPGPIQKISANWSMHDSNWFPDFPKSAEKATAFYEKTGGPTVDGVISITPVVLQKLLSVTGPIDMPEYGITIDKDNFIENIQTEVEQNYDKELNQPKKILSDLAPKILDKIFNPEHFTDLTQTMGILTDSLNERHILVYAKNWDIEKVLSSQGWSGEILDTSKDYISVINTNINGYKTDGVIDEKIEHSAEIQRDGSIIDTVTITRHHNGGNMPYEWWNKVNADYMRVYIPKGSKLISATGQTREINSPPLDYDALGYKRDPQVKMEEDSTVIDEKTGTRIYDESNKTVFANWVYVSPQETVEIKYSYLLPFKIETNSTTKPADTYSLLAQKQAGSIGSSFTSKIAYPDLYKVLWKYPERITQEGYTIKTEVDLTTDKFIGVALSRD